MQVEQQLSFGPYRFAAHTGQLWRGTQEVKLTPKATAVLDYLLARAGQVVTKEDFFAAAWPETVVSDAALSSCIQELRQVLRDDAKKPRFIETVHRRGYRFLGKVVSSQQEEANQKAKGKRQKAKIEDFFPALNTQHLAPVLVGREAELTQLHHWFEKALHGQRQLVFVTGEPGIGKTALVESFLDGLAFREQEESQIAKVKLQKSKVPNPNSQSPNPGVWVARGQCIEHYGAGEAYLPVLEALGRLCRESDGQQLVALLHQHAPSWLVQLPSLLNPAELEELQRRTAGVTRERMLRELAETLEVITQERLLVLVLEDLHWSDVSTLDLLSMLARRQERARLLIIGTYRPVEVLTREHPLKRIKLELQLHGQCEELALEFLSEAAVAEYLEQRFGGEAMGASLQSLAHLIHRRTDGNPLFMINVTNELVAQKLITNRDGHWNLQGKLEGDSIGIQENLRQLIEQQLARVSPDERKVLEAASVAGAEFSAAAVAAGTEQTPEAVETYCDILVRREQFLRAQSTSEWPDGTVAACYGFVHALYQEVLYAQLSANRRVRLHRQIGEREEQGYSDCARERAAELAVHFERGRDTKRAIHYLQLAGENASRRSAHQEAITLLTKGLALLNTLPDTPERVQHELTLQLTLGVSQVITKGYAAQEVEHTYNRARELCRQVRETSQLFIALGGLWQLYLNRAEFQTVCELGEELLALAQNNHTPDVLLMAHNALAQALHWRGEFAQSQTHVEQVIAAYDPQDHRSLTFLCAGEDPGIVCLTYMARNLWLLGYAEQALSRTQQALALAQEVSSPFDFSIALWSAAILHQWCGDQQQVQERTEAMARLSIEQEFAFWLAHGTILRGWALTEQGQVEKGIAQMQQGLEACRATGTAVVPMRYLPWLAAAYAQVGQAEQGLAVLAEVSALIDKTGAHLGEAELYRIKGTLTLQKLSVISSQLSVPNTQHLTPSIQAKVEQEAEECFLKAIAISQQQHAKSLELRATMSLARLWQQQALEQGARSKKQGTRTMHHETRNKLAAAHKVLSRIYNWFTEGFDTKDLQEAKALLEDLGETGKWRNREKDKG